MKSIQNAVATALAKASVGMLDAFAQGDGGAGVRPRIGPPMGAMGLMAQMPGEPAPRGRRSIEEMRDFIQKYFELFWIAAVVFSVVVTAVIVFILPVRMNMRFGIATAYWAFFIGGSALLFLPPKLIVTGFGGLAGSSGSDAVTGAGIITGIHKSVTDIADQLGVVAEDLGVSPDLFFKRMVWLFAGIVMLMLLPAFRDEKKGAMAAHKK